MYVNHNGILKHKDEPLFTASNRAFKYGDALFETMRIINGEIFLYDEHIERCMQGMLQVKMNFSKTCFKSIKKEIKVLLNENNILKGGRVRITFFRNEGGYYEPLDNNISYLIEANHLSSNMY